MTLSSKCSGIISTTSSTSSKIWLSVVLTMMECNLSAFNQVLYPSKVLRYVYFSWVFLFSDTLYLHSTIFKCCTQFHLFNNFLLLIRFLSSIFLNWFIYWLSEKKEKKRWISNLVINQDHNQASCGFLGQISCTFFFSAQMH